MVCISNCDKITPGMLMAAMRLNIPTIFVSGGPMEAGNRSLRAVRSGMAAAQTVRARQADQIKEQAHGGKQEKEKTAEGKI